MNGSELQGLSSEEELLVLRARVAELEERLARVEQERDAFEHIVQHAPAFISRLTPDGRTLYMNATCERLLGCTSEEAYGKNLLSDMYPGELMAPVEEYFRIAAEGGDVRDHELTFQGRDGARHTLAWNSFHRFGPDGALLEIVSFGMDVTERKRSEAERRRLQDEIIAMQAATLAELSTPLVPISEDIVAMPLVGAIDAPRAQRIVDTLLAGIERTQARAAILDITGVSMVDTHVADALLRAARAVRLLGAEVILTGIRSDVACTLIGLGASFEGIVTRGTLQSGIAFAMHLRG